MKIQSSAFRDNGDIPRAYTCDGNDRQSPALSFSDIPEGAETLVLIMDDPDVPKEIMPSGNFTHWVLFDIPATTTDIPAGGSVGTAGRNGAGDARYVGPCPPSEYEPTKHRYRFTLYALDRTAGFSSGAKRDEVEYFAKKHALATATLTGTYSRV